MIKSAHPRKHRSVLAGVAERLDRGSSLRDVCTSECQLRLVQKIAALASKRSQRMLVIGSAARRTCNRGSVSLFAGRNDPAKRKVVAALGAELGLDVYRVDLTNVVSKYIGETEKNLDTLLDCAVSSNVVLFFDEADALFGRRSEITDAHDRNANIEIDYLLARMDNSSALVILSVGNARILKEPLLRRFETIVTFGPQEAEGLNGEVGLVARGKHFSRPAHTTKAT